MSFDSIRFTSELSQLLSGHIPQREPTQFTTDMNAMITLGNRLDAVVSGDITEPTPLSESAKRRAIDESFPLSFDVFKQLVVAALWEMDITLRENRKALLENDFVNAYHEFARPARHVSPDMGLEPWLKSDEVGLSSLFMAKILSEGEVTEFKGSPIAFGIPHDVDDFRGCQKLLIAVPAFKDNMTRLMQAGPRWRALVEQWDAIDSLINNGENQAAYERILACIK